MDQRPQRELPVAYNSASLSNDEGPHRMPKLTAFKAYDVRGRMPDELNETLARDIGRAYAAFVKPKRVAVGYDIRLSSPALAQALKEGLKDGGCDVLDIGLWG